MIDILQKELPNISQLVKSMDGWSSLVINRRKPHTYRVFRQIEKYRVCLHRFESCDENEAFPHPHPWPGAFLLLQGEYIHTVGGSVDLISQPHYFIREIVRPNSIYEIVNPHTWHMVQPLTTTYTVMINGEPWNRPHLEVKTTKGKDLDSMSQPQLLEHLSVFDKLLDSYLQRK